MITKITASIVLYHNDTTILKAAINSFLNNQLDIHLYLIDNSLTSDLESISSDSRVSYFHNPSNPGFGAAHNIAIKKAIESGSEYHLVLNPDIYFEKGTLAKIVNFMDQNHDVGNLMPKVLYPDGQIQYLCKLIGLNISG